MRNKTIEFLLFISPDSELKGRIEVRKDSHLYVEGKVTEISDDTPIGTEISIPKAHAYIKQVEERSDKVQLQIEIIGKPLTHDGILININDPKFKLVEKFYLMKKIAGCDSSGTLQKYEVLNGKTNKLSFIAYMQEANENLPSGHKCVMTCPIEQ